jgi:hypothetical protein
MEVRKKFSVKKGEENLSRMNEKFISMELQMKSYAKCEGN